MHFFMAFFLLWAFPAFAEVDVKLIAKIERYNKNIQAADKDILRTKKEMLFLENTLKDLEETERLLRKKLVKNVNTFNTSARELARYARMPKHVQTMVDTLNIDPQRSKILTQGEKSLANTLAENRNSLNNLLDAYTQKKNKQDALKNQAFQLTKKRSRLAKLRQKHLKTLQIQDEALAKKLARSVNRPMATPRLADKEKSGQHYSWLPVNGRLIQNFAEKDSAGVTATGLTISTSASAKVFAFQQGTISYSGPFKTYGWLMIIDHGKNINTIYGGLGQTLLNTGDKVTKGTAIATLPNIPKPHLYFEVRQGGKSINPAKWIKQQ